LVGFLLHDTFHAEGSDLFLQLPAAPKFTG
jgi:hypothetical protein